MYTEVSEKNYFSFVPQQVFVQKFTPILQKMNDFYYFQ